MIRALRAGHQLLKTCGADGDQDSGFSIATTYDRKLCSMALLAPDIQRAILAGHQHADLTIDRLRKMEIPLAWEDQRAAFGF